MKLLLILQILLLPLVGISQNLIAYDYIEDYNWLGSGWSVGYGNNSDYPSNFSVSSNNSARLTGSGKSGSNAELGVYVLSNRTNLNPTSTYILKFRAASYKVSNPSAATAGVDVGDYFDVRYSIDGGSTYVTEMRITGFGNSNWDYNTNGSITKISSNTMTTYTPSAGGNRTNTGDGFSVISLVLPPNITQCAFTINARVESAGEEWWFDNFELWEEPITTLPVELTTFEVTSTPQGNLLVWKTASENNSSHYLIERSTTGEFTEKSVIQMVSAAGNSTELLTYNRVDISFEPAVNYYQLTQVDNDGQFKTYGPISIDNRDVRKKLIKIINLLGQEINPEKITTYDMYIEIYEDGTSKKVIR